jgi:hypothetical protein
MSLSQAVRDSRIIRNQYGRQSQQHLFFEEGKTTVYATPNHKIYIPTETGYNMHHDDTFIRLIMGPYGSGKSTWCCHEIVRRTCAMPAWHNGRRRARWIIIRNTSGELVSTTLQTWLMWFGELGDLRKRQKPLLTYEHIFNDGKGVVELELIFIALDREDDLRKVKSLEATGCYINELSEVPQGTLAHFKGRVNHRYPPISFSNDSYWSGIIADTNPPDVDHWIYRDFYLENFDGYRIFRQPPGLIKDQDNQWIPNPEADNYQNLAHDYYTKLASGANENFVKVFCLGEWGLVGFGKRVYPEYNDDLHSVDEIQPIQGGEIHLGWDGGLTPACIVVQISPRGQFQIIKEYIGKDIGLRTFAESIVLPNLASDFPYNKIGSSVFDPSGVARDAILEEMSCISELNSLGIPTIPAPTNDLDPRIASVRFFLNKMIDGQPGFILSRKNCPRLRKGFINDYVYKRVAVAGEERYKDKPDKNGASHPHDALQYVSMQFASQIITKEKFQGTPIDMYNPGFRYL